MENWDEVLVARFMCTAEFYFMKSIIGGRRRRVILETVDLRAPIRFLGGSAFSRS